MISFNFDVSTLTAHVIMRKNNFVRFTMPDRTDQNNKKTSLQTSSNVTLTEKTIGKRNHITLAMAVDNQTIKERYNGLAL